MLAYTYDATKNPDDLALPGVPMRDLTQADVDALPDHIQAAIAEAPYFAAAGASAWPEPLTSGTTAYTPPAVEDAADRLKGKRPKETKALPFEPEGADQAG